MSAGWTAIRLKDFEHVITRPGESLLRVCGSAPPMGEPGPRPELVILGADRERRFSPLPAPADQPGVLRAAYAVPTALVNPEVRCLLETADGQRIPLPEPVLGSGRMHDGLDDAHAHSPDIAAEVDALRRELAELERAREDDRHTALAAAAQAEAELRRAEERIATLQRELAQAAPAREALQRELTELRSRQASLEQELDHARDQLRIMTFERDELSRQADAFDSVAVKARERAAAAESASAKANAALRELEIWRGELERRLADTTTELGALKAAREADERELTRLRAETLQQTGGLGNGDSAETVSAQAEEIERLAAELAVLRSQAARHG